MVWVQLDCAMFLPVVVLLGVLLLSGPESTLQEDTREIDNSNDILEREFINVLKRQKRATADYSDPQADKCSYTFIVPQQKNNGAICVNSKEPEALLQNRVNKQELELLNSELQKQRKQIEALQLLVELDGGVINEVKLLRKESRNMNSRVTQLYMQLLHEIIRKRDNALEVSQLETRVLNHTNEMGRLAARYRDLEHKYQHLSALAGNQSALLEQLEEQCKQGGYSYSGAQERRRRLQPQPPAIPQPPLQMPALSPGGYRPFHPPTYTRYTNNPMINDIQSDQNTKALPPPLPTMPSATYSFTNEPSGPFRDCLEALESGYTTSGMYLLKPEKSNQLMQVWCDQKQDPGGWTVIMRRQDGSVNFFRNWDTYKQGFGNIDAEYWLGLNNIYWLTNQGTYKLLVTLEDWTGRKTFAVYASFRVESEADFYRLRLGQYHGNAGDSLTWHNGKQFTTLDRDHDVYVGNCAHYHKGGWWYNACAHSNLNGVWYRGGHYRSRYQDGVYWAEFRGGAYSLKKVTMMIRPNGNTFH
ncbi:angiopoietin-related protein 2-like [Archocentrus centrarchus]|uniref:angiopoietin-related protein 2-like n=1 Tax=Archocentrus centrarchus TaxID=63155 RepID=UPI0011EA0355|nr:angiopoietin-related protein 2-like [Archocentrus centrarchus]XP_030598132.1 angiopoietin-related protein 2-like [Archocentrus centrarchus]